MTAKLLKCLGGIIGTALLSLYLFVVYELAFIPAILEWSVYGVLLVLAISGLLILSVSAPKRLPVVVLGIAFLLTVRALDSISSYPILKYVFSLVIIFIILAVISKVLGRVSLRKYLVTFLIAVLLTTTLDLSQARLWTEFLVKWESPSLYKRLGTVDYFPVVIADLNGDGSEEIITQQNLEEAEEEKLKVTATGTKYQILEKEKSSFAVYSWNGEEFSQLSPSSYSTEKLKEVLPTDYLNYPFYETVNRPEENGGIEQIMNPLVDRVGLIENSVNFAAFPFYILQLSQDSLKARLQNQARLGQPAPSSVIAEGNIIPGPPKEKVSIDHVLTVSNADNSKPLGVIDNSMVAEIGTSEVILGDVDGDKTDELLLTAETSRILKLDEDGKWQILWSSIDSLDENARFQKFRFEDFAPLGKEKTPDIIALSKSYVRNNPTRYMTGYEYKDGALHQKWRVFSGLINLRAGDVDGDKENELIGYMYKAHHLFVLEKHNIPVTAIIYLITAGLIITGFFRQWRNRKNLPSGGEQVA